MIIWMLLNVPKLWGEMVLPHFFSTLPYVSISTEQILLQKDLLPRHCWSYFIQGWVSKLLKILWNFLIYKRLASDWIMSQENIKHCRKKHWLTMPSNIITNCYKYSWQPNWFEWKWKFVQIFKQHFTIKWLVSIWIYWCWGKLKKKETRDDSQAMKWKRRLNITWNLSIMIPNG